MAGERSGQDSTAFECRVLAATRKPVADPMPAEAMFPLSELERMLPLSDTAAGSERGRRSSRPSVSSRGTRTILKEPETRRLKNRGHLAIAVGTPITGRPPHRTVRAAFLHTAPTSDV